MILDTLTLLIAAALVITTSSGMFVAEAWVRTGDLVDRLWTLAFAAAITTALAYAVATLAADQWWVTAVGNGASVLCVWAMWSGIRAYQRRSSRVVVAFAVALLAVAAVLVEGPDGGAWAGAVVALGGTAVGALAGGVALLRGKAHTGRAALVLAAILLLGGLFYAVRSVVFVLAGPDSPGFEQYLGTAVTTLVNILLVNGAAFAAVTMRERTARQEIAEGQNFDARTGARTNHSFEPRAVEQLRRSAESLAPVAMVQLVPEGLETLELAFGADVAEQALVACGEVAQVLLPPRALMGLDPVGAASFQVLLPGWDESDAVEWATEVRRELVATRLEVPGSHVRIGASAGVADVRLHGYSLGELCDAARAAAQQAVADGNRVVTASAAGVSGARVAQPVEHARD
ncbi:GGDEF domain-containing protein [Georgenia yuyongxinii]|uniref:GGDEF domain-containing protein n=1 Tax=Georgenia yuyongxinii TaxID=2589797 RepID=A0A5B8C360_9MICO|nr:GGDEF domain-containing protein [Georgenia yuyongxinii]QDC23715.1 GGDEF domain-containing protein [Georgenia yuyongxinii]